MISVELPVQRSANYRMNIRHFWAPISLGTLRWRWSVQLLALLGILNGKKKSKIDLEREVTPTSNGIFEPGDPFKTGQTFPRSSLAHIRLSNNIDNWRIQLRPSISNNIPAPAFLQWSVRVFWPLLHSWRFPLADQLFRVCERLNRFQHLFDHTSKMIQSIPTEYWPVGFCLISASVGIMLRTGSAIWRNVIST